MKWKSIFTVAAFSVLTAIRAQELQPISPEEMVKATGVLMEANAGIGDLPLKFELAPDQAVGLKLGDVGAVFIPDRRLKTEKADRAERKKKRGRETVVGQLWMAKLSPKEKDAVLPNDRLRLVKVRAKDKELELAVFALGIEKAGKNTFQLTIYGKGSSPLLRVPLTAAKEKGAAPALLAARKTSDDGGVLELKLIGRYKAEIPVGKRIE